MHNPLQEEWKRLEALNRFRILDTPAEAIFDRLTRFAAALCDMPISTISLIDESRQWFKSAFGLDISETGRAISFCTHIIAQTKPSVVEDAHRHPKFRDNPLVTGPPHIRFYAGVPLITREGYAIGTLTVMDRKPRRLDQTKIDALEMMADQVMTHLELRRQRAELDRSLAVKEEINARLRLQAEHLREAQRIARIGSWEMAFPAKTLSLSEECFRIFGATEKNEAVPFDSFLRSVHDDDRGRLEQAVYGAIREQGRLDIIHRIVRPGGEIRHVHERGEWQETHGIGMLAGTVQDITEQHLRQEKFELLHNCISRVQDIVMITDAEPYDEPGPRIVFVNHAFERLTGYAPSEIIGRSPRFLQGPETQRAELDKIRHALSLSEHVSAELVNYKKNGETFCIEIDIDPVFSADGKIGNFIAIQRDVTQRKAAEKQIEQLAFYDTLTQLPNRRLLIDRLNQSIAAARRKQNCGALLFIDLDNFKSLNDSLGHDIGDQLLKQVARRLESSVRRSNTVARLGGDEFVIILEDLHASPQEAATQADIVAEKILTSFSEVFSINGYEYHCTPSIGVTLFGKLQQDADELLKRADLAMYQAKSEGRNTIRFFDQGMQAIANTRLTLDRDFRSSLKKSEFVLHYQPQVDDRGCICGVEALVRWQHPQRGMLYPLNFIALAEETGLIVPLGKWVLESACKQLAEWEKQAASPAKSIAVNVSARQFHHPQFLAQVYCIFERTGINPSGVKLELTESAFVERFDDTIGKMHELKRCGVRFSLDDFGTGYSSLSYLKKLPLNEIKIDQAFVQDILTDPDDAAIAKTIISLCQMLGFDVIAEGVENEEQRALLASQGCHLYQGNLISPPLPAEQLHAR